MIKQELKVRKIQNFMGIIEKNIVYKIISNELYVITLK